ncbi:MAG: hypothetical protein ABH950_09035 [Candidatus Altiarchaeota archaeon]
MSLLKKLNGLLDEAYQRLFDIDSSPQFLYGILLLEKGVVIGLGSIALILLPWELLFRDQAWIGAAWIVRYLMYTIVGIIAGVYFVTGMILILEDIACIGYKKNPNRRYPWIRLWNDPRELKRRKKL